MITGIPSVDNGLHEVTEQIRKSLEKDAEEKNELLTKLKNANRKEREFIIFKTFFNTLNDRKKEELSSIVKKHPFIIDKLWWIISEANDTRGYSKFAIYNRDICCKEIMAIYKSLLEDMTKLAKELNIKNSLELSILFSYLLWNGYLSKTRKQEFKEYDGPLLPGMNFTDISNGIGVCRNFSEMLKDFLNHNGYSSVILANFLNNNIKIDYSINVTRRKVCNIPSQEIFLKKKVNHAFNLIEDNGIYIYDPTNLLLYAVQNKNTATLVNGKGKNIIYPYYSYGFVYSKDDERLLDNLFINDSFPSPYDITEFINTSEINLELLRNCTSLLEDFYKETKPNILGIYEETNKLIKKLK